MQARSVRVAWVCLLLGAGMARAADPDWPKPPLELATVGGLAPMFRLPLYNPAPGGSSALGLDEYVGEDARDRQARVVLLSFTASFCQACKKELPYLQRLQEEYRARGLRVLMVSIDAEPEGQRAMAELIGGQHVTFPVLKDRFTLVARRWLGPQSPLPSVFLIRRDGVVRLIHRGYDQSASAFLTAAVESELGAGVEKGDGR